MFATSRSSSKKVLLILSLLCTPGFISSSAAADRAAPSEAPQLYVSLEVALPGAQPFVIVVPNGGLATYRATSLGESLGVIPTVIDRASGELDLRVVNVSYDENRQPLVGDDVRTVAGAVGFESFVSVDSGILEIRVTEVNERPHNLVDFATSGCSLPSNNLMPREPCCLTCGGSTGCGCCVSGGCGSCCGC